MKRLKRWLVRKFLPAYAKDTVYRENEALKAEIVNLRTEIMALDSYIDGLELGIRSQRRVTIHNEVKK